VNLTLFQNTLLLRNSVKKILTSKSAVADKGPIVQHNQHFWNSPAACWNGYSRRENFHVG